MRRNRLPEILAPAGNREAVTAAVLNGADAVYLGQKLFNARQNAGNFTPEEFFETVRYCHLHGVKVYQTLNTLVFDRELPQLRETVKTACRAGVDALIVQDFGVLRLVREWCPQMRVHASTQMSVHTLSGALLLREMGVRRVVLARELSREQIRRITGESGLETEVFVHGALCMSVSGQCYLSAALGGRSGNRGSCAGTCRLPFSAAGDPGRYALSLKDNCLAGWFGELCEAGVASLKIEGRMKRPEYVAAATAAYAGLKRGSQPDLEQLRAVFSRSGFTDGYFTGQTGPGMFGVRQKEDVLAATADRLAALRETYRREKPCRPVSMRLTVTAGQPARLEMGCDGQTAAALGEPPQPALHRPLTGEEARRSLEKLGGTVFFLQDYNAEIGPGLALPKSALNALRRDCVEQLEQALSAGREIPFAGGLPSLPDRRDASAPALRVRVQSAEQLSEEIWQEAEYVYLPFREAEAHPERFLPYSGKIILEPDRWIAGTEDGIRDSLRALREQGFSRLAVSNPAHLWMGRELGMALHGTFFLNCTNSVSAEQYRELGLCDLVLSWEQTEAGLRELRSGMPLGAAVYGFLSLMLLANCPVRAERPCGECRGAGSLTDRTGARFRVLCHGRRWQELLNSRRLWMLDRPEAFAGMDFSLLYFTTEPAEECRDVLAAWRENRKAAGEFTRGLYRRGVQ